MFDVSVIKCDSYNSDEVKQALGEALDAVGGLDWVKEGMKIAIKANLVSFMSPEKAATTHPALLCELVKMLTEKGAEVVIGDSPGGIYNSVYVNKVYKATGMYETEKFGAKLNRNFEQTEVKNPDGMVLKSFIYTSWLDEADAVINFCKLKTHGMMGMSAAAKNIFGVIPGTLKPEYHFRFPSHDDFARMMVDLDEFFKVRLCICDAVVGMEGNGPTMGTPRKIGAVLASESPHKMDLVCAKIIGLNISVSDSAVNYLTNAGFDSQYGARPLRRLIQKNIEDKLATGMINGEIKADDTIVIEEKNEKIQFTIIS